MVQLCYYLPLWLVRFPRITELSEGSALAVTGNETKHLITKVGILCRQGSFFHYPHFHCVFVEVAQVEQELSVKFSFLWRFTSSWLEIFYFLFWEMLQHLRSHLLPSRLHQTAAIRPKVTQLYRKIYLEYEKL